MSLDIWLHEGEKEVFQACLTHTLAPMAREVDLYFCIWCPEELLIEKAHQMIEPLKTGIGLLQVFWESASELCPKSEWGTYDLFRFAKRYLEECIEHPDADVSAWR